MSEYSRSGSGRLIYAAKSGDVVAVTAALRAGADPEVRDFDANNSNYTALHWSALKSHKNVVIKLLAAGVNVDSRDDKGATALHKACRYGDKDVALLLIGRGAEIDATNNEDITPLMVASEKGHDNLVSFLLDDAGADADFKDKNGEASIHYACQNGHDSIVHILAQHGADIQITDNKDWQALHFAAYKGHDLTVSALIQLGANVNCTNNKGNTPLFLASQEGHLDVIKTLFRNGAHETVTTQRWQATHIAAKRGRLNVLMQLNEYGLDLHAKAKGDNTPLHMAVQNNHENVAEWLILNGANPFTCNTAGDSAIHLALNKKYTDLVTFMASKNLHSRSSGGSAEATKLECAVCLDHRTSTVMTLPCRHAKTCQNCSDRMEENNNNKCPICRKEIEQRISIFL